MILTKPTDMQLAAIARLYNTEEFRMVRAFLESDAKAQDDALRETADTVQLRRIQGGAQYVRDLLDVFDKARDALEKRDRVTHKRSLDRPLG